MRLVLRDFFLELVDGSLERPHRQLAHAPVLASIVAQFFVSPLQPCELGVCVGEFNVVLKTHEITSIMLFGIPIRSIPKVTFTSSLKSSNPTSVFRSMS